jgi:hypothetical protein
VIYRIKNDVRACITQWCNNARVRKYAPINKPIGSTLFSERYLLIAIARILCPCKARQKEEEEGKELFHVYVFYKFITLIVKLPEEGFTAEDE